MPVRADGQLPALRSPVVLLLAALVVAGLAVAPAHAIVVSDDPALHVVLDPNSSYNMVGYINQVYGATGVLIGPNMVLTAKHVVQNVPEANIGTISFTLNLPGGPRTYYASSRAMEPDVDLALLRLTESTGMSGYGLFSGTNEAGKTGIIVGYGTSGTGQLGWDTTNYPRGTLRWAKNKIEAESYDVYGEGYLGFDFDGTADLPQGPWDETSLGASLEGGLAHGDSGGPLFIATNGVLMVAGIHSYVLGAGTNAANGFYGEAGLSTRISQRQSWISEQMPDANGDMKVDVRDLSILAFNYNATEADRSMGDFNNDGIVDVRDLALLAFDYGLGTGMVPVPPGSFDQAALLLPPGALMPEPAALAVMGLGAMLLLRRRRTWPHGHAR